MYSMTVDLKVPNIPLLNGEATRVVDEEMRTGMNAAVLIVKGEILPLTPIDRGMLRQGVQTSLTGEATSLTGRIFDPVTHALPMELGTRPHFPPVGPLIGWVQRKLGVSAKDAPHVAFLVARSISRKGTKAREFFKRGWQVSEGRVRSTFERVNARIGARLGGGQ